MNYDIFISYKRKGTSSATAAYLYELLQQKGYNVFFDRKEMRSGKFNEQLLEHISNATDILILLEEESLGSWFDNRPEKKKIEGSEDEDSLDSMELDSGLQEEPYKSDWFCKEVMHALDRAAKNPSGTNIVPILLNGYEMPKKADLPPEMAELADLQALKLEISEAEEFYDKYFVGQHYLHSKPTKMSLNQRFQGKGGIVGCFLFYTDAASCDLFECGELVTTLTEDEDEWHPFRYPVSFAGEHRFRAINNDSCDVVTIRSSVETYCQQYVQIQFEETRNLWKLTPEEINAQDDVNLLFKWGQGLFEGTSKHEPDIALSFECLSRAIDLGSQEALSFVSSYGSGLIAKKHAPLEIAVKWYQIAAEQGNKDAQRNMGHVFRKGEGAEQNYEKAIEWYLKAAEQGDAVSQRLLGFMCIKGLGTEIDTEKALEWYTKAAEQGDALSQKALGRFYYNGTGVEKDYGKSFEWYRKAAEQGNVVAQRVVGFRYSKGSGVEKDYGKALEWYTKAAEQGDIYSQKALGRIYFNGTGVKKDPGKSFEWYMKAAEQSDVEAQRVVGFRYGKGSGVEKDFRKSFEWYTKAAEQGDVYSQKALGRIYYSGLGVEKDTEKAFEWYMKAAEQGDVESQRALGTFYYKGQGVEKDYEKAIEWFMKAAEKGDAASQNALGLMYERGHGVEKEHGKAIEWFMKAAEQGVKSALNSIAWAYHLMGDYENALPWAEKAIEATPDDPNVVDTLATVYEDLGRYEEALEQFEKCLQMYEEKGNEKGKQRTLEKIDALKKKIHEL